MLERGFQVTALDPSPKMLERLRAKTPAAVWNLETRLGSTRSLSSLPPFRGEPFQGAFAFLGPLNYDPGLEDFGGALAGRLAPGACFVFSWFSSLCLWSLGADFLRGRWARLSRRIMGQGVMVEVGGRKLLGFCHSWTGVNRAFGKFFEPVERQGMGVILPSHAWEGRIPPALRGWLSGVDGVLERLGPFRALGELQAAVLRSRRLG